MAVSKSFVGRLHSDVTFRKRFAKSPRAVLAAAGLDPDALSLPDHIDEQDLERRLNQVFSGRDWHEAFAASNPGNLTAKDLWDRFGIIGWASDAAVRSDDPAVATAVVIYGVSVVTSSSSQVATQGNIALAVVSVEQVRALRDLARLPRESLRFSIAGPDGVAIEGVSADLLAAFLARVK